MERIRVWIYNRRVTVGKWALRGFPAICKQLEVLGTIVRIIAAIPVIYCTVQSGTPSASLSKEATNSTDKDHKWLLISAAVYVVAWPFIADLLKYIGNKVQKKPVLPVDVLASTLAQSLDMVRDKSANLRDVARVVGGGIQEMTKRIVAREEAPVHVEIFKLRGDSQRGFTVLSRVYDSDPAAHDYAHLFRDAELNPLRHLVAPYQPNSPLRKPDMPTIIIRPDGEYERAFYKQKGIWVKEKPYAWHSWTNSYLMAVVAAPPYRDDDPSVSDVAEPFALICIRSDKFDLNTDQSEVFRKMILLATQPLIQQFIVERSGN